MWTIFFSTYKINDHINEAYTAAYNCFREPNAKNINTAKASIATLNDYTYIPLIEESSIEPSMTETKNTIIKYNNTQDKNVSNRAIQYANNANQYAGYASQYAQILTNTDSTDSAVTLGKEACAKYNDTINVRQLYSIKYFITKKSNMNEEAANNYIRDAKRVANAAVDAAVAAGDAAVAAAADAAKQAAIAAAIAAGEAAGEAAAKLAAKRAANKAAYNRTRAAADAAAAKKAADAAEKAKKEELLMSAAAKKSGSSGGTISDEADTVANVVTPLNFAEKPTLQFIHEKLIEALANLRKETEQENQQNDAITEQEKQDLKVEELTKSVQQYTSELNKLLEKKGGTKRNRINLQRRITQRSSLRHFIK